MSRKDIYYWKCDRPAAFHGTQARSAPDAEIERQLHAALQRQLQARNVELAAGAGQGNHLTWNADVDGVPMFVRVENGPEKDGQLAVESAVLNRVRECGVATPRVYACDATRDLVPFAWQALERIPAPDLNHWFKRGELDHQRIAFDIGVAVATWQQIQLDGFGPCESADALRGCHSNYEDYFFLRLDRHLGFLVESGFFSSAQQKDIESVIHDHRAVLQIGQGCLVHKDLALWNILGSRDHIAAFIDFDDAVCGDTMDDLSLLACFHDAAFLRRAFDGYQSVRPLLPDYRRRFWLHLLRNMIVKAVIRVGAGYFDRTDGFFLIGSGSSGADLKTFTQQRLQLAVKGLASDADLTRL